MARATAIDSGDGFTVRYGDGLGRSLGRRRMGLEERVLRTVYRGGCAGRGR